MQRKATIFVMLWLALPGSAQPVHDQIADRFNAWAETQRVVGAVGIAQRGGSGRVDNSRARTQPQCASWPACRNPSRRPVP